MVRERARREEKLTGTEDGDKEKGVGEGTIGGS